MSPGEGSFRTLETKHNRTAPHSYLFQRGDYRNKGHNPKKMTWVFALVKMVSVAQKLSTTEKCH